MWCCPGRKPLGMLALLATGSGPLTGSLWVASAITFPSPEGVGTCRFGNTPRTREALLARPSPVTAVAPQSLPSRPHHRLRMDGQGVVFYSCLL